MSRSLDLDSEWDDDDTLVVSWNDPIMAEFSLGTANAFGAVVGIGALVCFIGAAATMNFWLILIGIIWVFGGLWLFKTPTMESRSVVFTADYVTVNGRDYETDTITRFDYGLRSALTGKEPWSNDKGHRHADPMMIRMWIDDAAPVDVSMNNWQTQVNHEIRNALAQALDEVRQIQVEEARAEKYGDQGDLGMPDY